jgi:hypothetical protein
MLRGLGRRVKVCWLLAVLAEVVREEDKARFWGSGPGNGRNLETFGCYLFFLAFFFAGMFSASCSGVARFAVDGQELWPTRLTPQYVVACRLFVKRNLQILFARAKT